MSIAQIWSDAIGAALDPEGEPSLETVVSNIRGAVVEAGYISRGRITSGLKEAYGPLGFDENRLRAKIAEALRLLLLTGDLDEFETAAGRGYVATPPRHVAWGGDSMAILGAAPEYGGGLIRRTPAGSTDHDAVQVSLSDELGRPEWRSALVELHAGDDLEANVCALFALACNLASSGARYSLDEPQSVAVLSARGKFFGRSENVPSGRWQRVGPNGCFPAVVKSGFSSSYVILNVSEGAAKLWQPTSIDLWRWIVVSATISSGDPIVSYDPATQRLDFLTPPPRQIERAVMLAGSRIGAWSWTVEASVHAAIGKLMFAAR